MKPPGVYAADTKLFDIIDRRALAEKVLEVQGRMGGLVYSRRGYWLYSDAKQNLIFQWKPGSGKQATKEKKGKTEEEEQSPKLPTGEVVSFQKNLDPFFMEPMGGPEALTLDHQGRLLICSGEKGQLLRVEKNGEPRLLSDRAVTARAGTSLDLVYAIDGSVYYIDSPTWIESNGGKSLISEKPAVYRIARTQLPLQHDVTRVSVDCAEPGGIALSPKQDLLYVSDAARNNIRVHPINPDASLASSRVFAEFPTKDPGSPSGLKTDEKGNVYAAGPGGLSFFSPTGNYLGVLATPEPPQQLNWGPSFHNLYFTAGKTMYQVATKIPGTRTY